MIRRAGPEMLSEPVANRAATNSLINTKLPYLVNSLGMAEVTDGRMDLLSKKGFLNHYRFFPAGCNA